MSGPQGPPNFNGWGAAPPDFEIITRSRSVSSAVANRDDLARLAIGLLEDAMPLPKAVRLLGVSLSSLRGENDMDPQLDFSI